MNPFRLLTRVFIDVFGITRPTEQQQRRATWFISILLGVILLGGGVVFLALYRLAQR